MDPPAAAGAGAGAAANANGFAPLPLPLPLVAAAAGGGGGGGAVAVANANGLALLPLPLPPPANQAPEAEEEEGHHDGALVVGDQLLALAPAAPADLVAEAEEEEGHHDGALVVGDQLLALAPDGDEDAADEDEDEDAADAMDGVRVPPLQPHPSEEELDGDEDGHHAASDGNQGQLAEVVVQKQQEVGVQGPGQTGGLAEVAVQQDPQRGVLHSAAPETMAPQLEHKEVEVEHKETVPSSTRLLAHLHDDDDGDQYRRLLRQSAPAAPPSQMIRNLLPGDSDDDDEADQNLLLQPAQVDIDTGNQNYQPHWAAAYQYQVDLLGCILVGVTVLLLGGVLLTEMGTKTATWNATLEMMTMKKWVLAAFIATGDIISLLLTYAPAWKFWRMWRREGAAAGAGLDTMVPPIVALLSSSVWVFYGAALPSKNWSVIVINGAGAAFQAVYATVFCTRSEVPWRHKLLVLLLGAGVGAVIAIVDLFLLYSGLGLTTDGVIGWSGAVTTGCTYILGCAMNLSAAARTRGADGMPAQAWATLANAGVWLVVAALAQDWPMVVLNVVGIGCFIVQAGQLVNFRLRKPPLEESEEALGRGLLQDQV